MTTTGRDAKLNCISAVHQACPGAPDSIKGSYKRTGRANPFSVVTSPIPRKRKRNHASRPDCVLFTRRPSVRYKVQPTKKWKRLRRYKKFNLSGAESIAKGQYILVNHYERKDHEIDVLAQWKAKVLEIRAHDSDHVYLRVAWLERPEDLPSGRLPHHGRCELVATNHMDIIDAMTVNGSVKVCHWNERDDETTYTEGDVFFWRQTYDMVSNRGFSKIRRFCVDSVPQNPDELMLQCEDCWKWMHAKCITQRAVERAAGESKCIMEKCAVRNSRSKSVAIEHDSLAQTKAERDGFTAVISPAPSLRIIVTDTKGQIYFDKIRCLFCGSDID